MGNKVALDKTREIGPAQPWKIARPSPFKIENLKFKILHLPGRAPMLHPTFQLSPLIRQKRLIAAICLTELICRQLTPGIGPPPVSSFHSLPFTIDFALFTLKLFTSIPLLIQN